MPTFARIRQACCLKLIVCTLILLLPLVTHHSSLLYGQTGTASLSGRVTDQQNAVIPDVEIEIRNVSTNVTQVTRTNGDGIYSFPALPPGNYLMSVRKQQFRTVSVTGIELHTQDSLARNFVLQVGSSAESVTVNANAEHMETDNPAVGLLVARTFVENMPLNGRSFQDLIALAPGTVSSVHGASGGFSINGQRSDANYFTVDGVSANVTVAPDNSSSNTSAVTGTLPSQTALNTTQSLVPVDALQEFKIQTSGYTAEYGRQPGGQIQFTTRSGTNELHGTLFEYFRNEALDANSWFNNQSAIPRQSEKQNDFGGTFGGPVVIPRLYNGTNKTFFFFSYEGLRLRLPQFNEFDVPTAALRQFAAPGIQTFLNALPLPNGPDNGDQCAASLDPKNTFSCTGQFRAGVSNPSTINSVGLRFDQSIGQRLQLFGRFASTTSSQTTRGNSITELDKQSADSYLWTIGASARLSPNLLDEFRVNYTSVHGGVDSTLVSVRGSVPYAKSLVIPPQFASPGTSYANFFDFFPPNANSVFFPTYKTEANKQRQYNLVNVVSWARADHLLKVGGDYRRLLPAWDPVQYEPVLIVQSAAAIQQGYADIAVVQAQQLARPTINNLSLYAEDHWKVTHRFTMDYGLRWEFNPVPGASDGIYPLAITTTNFASMQLAPKGTPQYKTTYKNFAPRLGVAYHLTNFGNHSLVVRAGGGLFYDTGEALAAAGYAGYPFSVIGPFLQNLPLPASPASLAPPGLNIPLVPPYGPLNGVSDPHLKLPYTEQWNLATDLALSSKNTMTFSYVGNAGRKLLFTNLYFPTNNQNFSSGISITNNAASSSYHSLQVQDSGYIGKGLQLIGAWTWSHAIDDNSSNSNSNGFPPLRGNSDNDVRNVINLALNYQIPGKTSSRVGRALTQGWLFATRFTAQSGYPVDVFQGRYTSPIDGSTIPIRPDLVSGVPIYLHNAPDAPGGWELNKMAFSPVPTDPNTGAPLRQGTLGRNFVHGPAFWNLNTSLQRGFAIHEGLSLLFRVDAFNIFNHPNFGNVDSFLTDSTFGRPLPSVATIGVNNALYATGAARSLQLNLKLQF